MFNRFKKIRLKVPQRVFISLLVIALFVLSYIANTLITIDQLDEKFQIVTQQAVPLNAASTELLSGQADYLQLLQGIYRLDNSDALNKTRSQLKTQAQDIQTSFTKLETLKSNYKDITSVLPPLKQDFSILQNIGDSLLNQRQFILTLNQALPEQFSRLQIALGDIKQNLIYVSEESKADISTETYHIVDNSAKIHAEIQQIYLSRSAEMIATTAPKIEASINIITKNFEALESTGDFHSDDWELALEAYHEIKNQLTTPNQLLDNLKNLAELNINYQNFLSDANIQSEHFSTKIKRLNQATQGLLTDASNLFGETLESNRLAGFMLSIIVFGTITLIGFMLQRSIKGPLTAFKAYVDQVEMGDLTRPLNLDSGDEFEETANKLNNLSARLRQVMQKLGHQANDAESTADYVVNASKELSKILNDQIDQVTEINQFMNTLKNASEQVIENVARTYSQIDEVSGFTSQATKESGHSSETVGGLMHLLTQTTQSVEQLAKDIHEIHGMTDMISNVADQTNLLALNAAIEAARAGSHGRGFAVVADEVRSLAISTQETTDIIRNRIEKIVAQSNESKSNVKECFTIAEQAHERFISTGTIMEKIDQATAEVSAFTAEVSHAAGQQTQYITACETSLKKINTLAQLNSATFEGISTIMFHLVDLTRQLSNDAAYFKYEDENAQ